MCSREGRDMIQWGQVAITASSRMQTVGEVLAAVCPLSVCPLSVCLLSVCPTVFPRMIVLH